VIDYDFIDIEKIKIEHSYLENLSFKVEIMPRITQTQNKIK